MTDQSDGYYYCFRVSSDGLSDEEWAERCDKAFRCIMVAIEQTMDINKVSVSDPYMFRALRQIDSGFILDFNRNVNAALEDYKMDLNRFGFIRNMERVSKEYAERIINDVPSVQRKKAAAEARKKNKKLIGQARIKRPKIR